MKVRQLILTTILLITTLTASSAPVTVKRQIPQPQSEQQTKQGKPPQLTSEQKLNKIKQYAQNYVRKINILNDGDDIGSDFCELKFKMSDLGAENIILEIFVPEYYFKDKVKTGFKYNGVIYRNPKRCVKLEFVFENQSYFTGYCK